MTRKLRRHAVKGAVRARRLKTLHLVWTPAGTFEKSTPAQLAEARIGAELMQRPSLKSAVSRDPRHFVAGKFWATMRGMRHVSVASRRSRAKIPLRARQVSWGDLDICGSIMVRNQRVASWWAACLLHQSCTAFPGFALQLERSICSQSFRGDL